MLSRRHPWIFSGAVAGGMEAADNGAVVIVVSSAGNYLATGHFQKSSIAVRLLSFSDPAIDQAFYENRIQSAVDFRKNVGLEPKDKDTNCFRLINGEGDGLPGLIADFYNGLIVLQYHSYGMHRQREFIETAFAEVMGKSAHGIIGFVQGLDIVGINDNQPQDQFNQGDGQEVTETGIKYLINPFKGQKTGFFLDQRDNRVLLRQMSQGMRVLNTFSYTGGFSLNALKGGAMEVVSVDSSSYASEMCKINEQVNGFSGENHEIVTGDVFEFLKEDPREFNVVILDPPAFAKSRKKSHNAVQAYKRLNREGLKKVKKGGFLITFSCSQVIASQLFEDTIRAAAIECGRPAKIIKRLGPGTDHPVSVFHPEGHYLKGLLVHLDG